MTPAPAKPSLLTNPAWLDAWDDPLLQGSCLHRSHLLHFFQLELRGVQNIARGANEFSGQVFFGSFRVPAFAFGQSDGHALCSATVIKNGPMSVGKSTVPRATQADRVKKRGPKQPSV
jgi:hypothetical protein